jgi:7-cyano-7-deazaguanine synthase
MSLTPVHPTETGLLLSGGIDSVVLLDRFVSRGGLVVPFYVQTGCVWEREERKAVDYLLSRLARPNLHGLVELEMPLADIYGHQWSLSGNNVPDGSTPDEAVFLPGRTPLLLIKPALWCRMNGIGQLAIATLAGNPFRDATPEFFGCFEAMLQAALGGHVQIVRPLERTPKCRVMELGRHLPLELTFSCLAPIRGMHCGQCNKCAERRRGFREVGLDDRTNYVAAPELDASLTDQSRH